MMQSTSMRLVHPSANFLISFLPLAAIESIRVDFMILLSFASKGQLSKRFGACRAIPKSASDIVIANCVRKWSWASLPLDLSPIKVVLMPRTAALTQRLCPHLPSSPFINYPIVAKFRLPRGGTTLNNRAGLLQAKSPEGFIDQTGIRSRGRKRP